MNWLHVRFADARVSDEDDLHVHGVQRLAGAACGTTHLEEIVEVGALAHGEYIRSWRWKETMC